MRKRFLLLVGCLVGVLSGVMAQSGKSDTIYLRIYSDSVKLDEVLVKAKRTPAANSRWSDLHPVDLVTTGGANGDLYRALQTLPGTQVQGESGRLLVRGGSSEETQTYIDGMHVLNPYTSTANNTPARGRYSTFMFSGISLSSGGAPLEYGEALSAVLPLDTKDNSRVNKLGLNASTIGFGGGGTRAFNKGSLSVNLDYQNLAAYNQVYSSRFNFRDPYRMASGATQFRYHPTEQTLLKIYAEYDRTDFSNYQEDDGRLFGLGEDNMYLNATFRHSTGEDWNWFAGMAYSYFSRNIDGAVTSGDGWWEQHQELHLKIKASKRFSPLLRLEMGAESFLRRYKDRYLLNNRIGTEAMVTGDTIYVDSRHAISPVIGAGFFSVTYYPLEKLKGELSFRSEYTSLNRRLNFSPRLALNYYWEGVVLSATAGRYTQLPQNEYLTLNHGLKSEVCVQYNLGIQHQHEGRVYKAEFYYKKYNRLALFQGTVQESGNSVQNAYGQAGTLLEQSSGTSGLWSSNGYGQSKGVDLFFDDRTSFRRFEYQLSYTYNLSKRKYAEYTELTVPQYATRHNASLVMKYSIPRWGTIIGLTNRFSSGRPYHNPNRTGLMNDEVKPYNSLDLGLTFLPSKKVIIHASATNILCRKNEFGKVDNKAVLATSDHFFYIGVFITLGKKAAYDVSNF